MATKNQIIGGLFQDAKGNPLALGYLLFELSQDAQVNSNTQIAAGYTVKITLNSSGSVDTTTVQSVWPNDVLVPAGTFYNVSGYSEDGQLVWGPNPQQVSSSPSPFDIGVWVPGSVNVSGTPAPPTNGFVLLNPPAGLSQIITQQDETGFEIISPAVEMISQTDTEGIGGAIVLTSVSNSATSLTGNITLTTETTAGASQSGNITLTTDSTTSAQQAGNIVLTAVSTDGDQTGNISIVTSRTGTGTSIGSGDISISANAPVSTSLNQGRVSLFASNYISLQDNHYQYLFGGAAANSGSGGPLTGFGVLDFSAMPLDGTNRTFTVPNIDGELGVIAGATVAGNIPKFDPTGKWLVDSGMPSSGATGSFTSNDGKTITVTNGIITSIV